uniref:TMV resistance protein N n=1 Tax=Cajanus cajan TaxID=3821 RepID=A0A151QXH3_CAJCA|nr:TMV resistance protein N [Cajanus cajan]
MVVFSESYASSTWCLDELVKILECTKIKDKKQLLFPILYHVEPSDIRHQQNSYGEAMIAHQVKFGKDSKKVQSWRTTLFEARNFPGHHISTGYEINSIEEIVEKVYKSIAPKPLLTGHNPVGLEKFSNSMKQTGAVSFLVVLQLTFTI